ncbi:hypothetical protein AVEN_63383-1 [Araneus ventricosus]|uniref:Uncharacterized protein n=1 Tax=Araneus ventricosus TaxID=182803 RepID=A0A4Y2KXY9_ARAVE|nr:hypothetical protein AVEN_63383-1 [Araneus ventricosus]
MWKASDKPSRSAWKRSSEFDLSNRSVKEHSWHVSKFHKKTIETFKEYPFRSHTRRNIQQVSNLKQNDAQNDATVHRLSLLKCFGTFVFDLRNSHTRH